MRNKQRCCSQLQNHVSIQNFWKSNWKITMLEKSAYFFVVLWHGGARKRNVWNDIVSWQTGRLNNSVKQNTFTRHIFSHLHALISMSHVTLTQVWVSAHFISCVICMLRVTWFCTTLPFAFHRLSHLPFSLSCSSSSSSMWVGSMRSPIRV